MTGGIGADLVECSGSAPGIASAIDLVRKKGPVCAIGLTGKPSIPFPWDKAAFKVCELTEGDQAIAEIDLQRALKVLLIPE